MGEQRAHSGSAVSPHFSLSAQPLISNSCGFESIRIPHAATRNDDELIATAAAVARLLVVPTSDRRRQLL